MSGNVESMVKEADAYILGRSPFSTCAAQPGAGLRFEFLQTSLFFTMEYFLSTKQCQA